jgi:predicted alpha/beta-fold hydrolase
MHDNYFLKGKHFQTIIPALLRKSNTDIYSRSEFKLSDGDFVDIDWIKSGKKKLLLICHGLEGSSHGHYATNLANAAKDDFDVAAFNFRSCSGRMNLKPRLYHSGDTQDIREFLNSVKDQYESIMGVGFSLGGNVILKYLGEEGDNSVLDCGIACSTPVDLEDSAHMLAKGFSLVYSRHLINPIIKKMQYHRQNHDLEFLDWDRLVKAKTFIEFDEIVTAKLYGFKDAKDYWTQSSSKNYFSGIKKQAYLVNAKNDPFLGKACYPNEPSHINFIYPREGGHVGFYEWGLNTKSKFDQSIVQLLKNA